MRISDWSSDVCSSDLVTDILIEDDANGFPVSELPRLSDVALFDISPNAAGRFLHAKLIIAVGEAFDHVVSGSMNCTFPALIGRSEEHTSELQSLMRISYAVFCLKKKKTQKQNETNASTKTSH